MSSPSSPPHSLSAFFRHSLEDAVRNALQTLLPTSPGTTSNPRTEFYDKFQREAEEHDRYFLEKYGADLDITLLFVGLLSHILSERY
jgi:hypothetical protein